MGLEIDEHCGKVCQSKFGMIFSNIIILEIKLII